LIDNAIKYTEAGTTSVALQMKEHPVLLEVSDPETVMVFK
jgi:hypothetical protein